tara:strand:- start:193 stop:447 length:255 start_codon:yes stop_codon:yes gene_type:complete
MTGAPHHRAFTDVLFFVSLLSGLFRQRRMLLSKRGSCDAEHRTARNETLNVSFHGHVSPGMDSDADYVQSEIIPTFFLIMDTSI